MSNIHIEGFEQFYGAPSLYDAFTRAGYEALGTWVGVAGRISPSMAITARAAWLSRKLAWTKPKFSVGFSFQMEGRGSVAQLKIGASVVTLWMHPDTGLPMLNQNVGGALPTTMRWYYFELEIDRAGLVSLYINNRFDSSVNIGGLVGGEVELKVGFVSPAEYRPGVDPTPSDNYLKTYDDLYMRDDARIGPLAITTRFPTIDQHVEWFNTLGSSHSQTLSERPPRPLDAYVASDTIGKEDRFVSTVALANGNAVVATAIVVLARKSPTLNAKLGVFIGGQAGAPLRTGVRTVESDWRTQYICFDATVGDTPVGIAASEFGINVAAP